jgi:hypothetical protein
MHIITGQVLYGFLISPKGFIPSVLRSNLIFLGSLEKSSWLRSKCIVYKDNILPRLTHV